MADWVLFYRCMQCLFDSMEKEAMLRHVEEAHGLDALYWQALVNVVQRDEAQEEKTP